jgi:hypothetical protein
VKGPADLVEDQVNGLVCSNPQDMAARVVEYLQAPASERKSFHHQAIAIALCYQATDIMDRMLADIGMPVASERHEAA